MLPLNANRVLNSRTLLPDQRHEAAAFEIDPHSSAASVPLCFKFLRVYQTVSGLNAEY
jgi:hypothetical protein